MIEGPRTTHSPGVPSGTSFISPSTRRTSISGEGSLRKVGTSPGSTSTWASRYDVSVCPKASKKEMPSSFVRRAITCGIMLA